MSLNYPISIQGENMAKKPASEDSRSALNQQMTRAVCEPFAEDKIKTRDGRAGQKWKYVPSAEMVNRLNQVFGIRWSSEEVFSEYVPPNNPTHIVKRVRITIPDPDVPDLRWYREGDGSHPLFDNRGKPYDPGDCHKSAESKAFSKAASKVGIALHLWGVDGESYEEGVAENFPPWEGQNQFAPPPTPPNVTVVNPGEHNQPPQFPPVPPVMVPHQTGPPQMVNPTVVAPPPVNNGYPEAGVPFPQMSNPVGMSSGPGTPVKAQLPIQAQPQASPSNGGVVEYQLNAIKGSAANRQKDPMELVFAALGPEAQGITSVELLSFDQALRVLDYMRSTSTNSF
jgi:hypothetical protein